MNANTPDAPVEHELPMLAGIAAFFHWWEELLNIVNGPVLMFGAGIALIDLLTDGRLTATNATLLFIWAGSQALGIDTQLLGSFARAKHRHGWARAGWLILGVILGYAAWQAGDVFAVQQSQHISEAAALAQLGMSPSVWLGWRAFLAVGLVALAGWTRYVAPRKALSFASEKERLEHELALAPMRAAARQNFVKGWRNVAATAIAGRPATDDLPTPPTGPGTPIATPAVAVNEAQADAPVATRVTTPRRRTTRRSSAKVTPIRAKGPKVSDAEVERRVRAAWNAAPLRPGKGRLSNTALARNAGVSPSSASKWTNVLKREDANADAGQIAR